MNKKRFQNLMGKIEAAVEEDYKTHENLAVKIDSQNWALKTTASSDGVKQRINIEFDVSLLQSHKRLNND